MKQDRQVKYRSILFWFFLLNTHLLHQFLNPEPVDIISLHLLLGVLPQEFPEAVYLEQASHLRGRDKVGSHNSNSSSGPNKPLGPIATLKSSGSVPTMASTNETRLNMT